MPRDSRRRYPTPDKDDVVDTISDTKDDVVQTISDTKENVVNTAKIAARVAKPIASEVHHYGLDHFPEYRVADGIVQDIKHEANEPDNFDTGSIFLSSSVRIAQGIFDRVAGPTSLGSEETLRFSELDDETQQYVKRIYGESIEYEDIRIESGGKLADNDGKAPHVVGNVIYVSSDFVTEKSDGKYTVSADHLDTFGHEVGHVWQNQNGGGDYAHQGLIAQGEAILDNARSEGQIDISARNDAYNGVEALESGIAFEDLNPEEQADVAGAIGQHLQQQESRPPKKRIPLPPELQVAHNQILKGDGAPV